MSVSLNINDEARKHLLRFLKKAIDGSYTELELEDFSMASYSNKSFELIRSMVVKMIAQIPRKKGLKRLPLSEDDRHSIEDVVYELEQQGI